MTKRRRVLNFAEFKERVGALNVSSLPDKVYTKQATVSRFGFVLSPAQARVLFAEIVAQGVNVDKLDEVEFIFYIERPEKKGGGAR